MLNFPALAPDLDPNPWDDRRAGDQDQEQDQDHEQEGNLAATCKESVPSINTAPNQLR
jgi:hypothetical protein